MLRRRSVSPVIGVVLLIIVTIAMIGLLATLILSLTKSTHSITFINTHEASFNGTHFNWRGVIHSTGDGRLTYASWGGIEYDNLSINIDRGNNLVSLSFRSDIFSSDSNSLIVGIDIDGTNFLGRTPVSFVDES